MKWHQFVVAFACGAFLAALFNVLWVPALCKAGLQAGEDWRREHVREMRLDAQRVEMLKK